MNQFNDQRERDMINRLLQQQVDRLRWSPVFGEEISSERKPQHQQGAGSGTWACRIVSLALLSIAAVLAVAFWPQIVLCLSCMRNIGPGHAVEDQATGLICFGLIGAVLVAIVGILARNERH